MAQRPAEKVEKADKTVWVLALLAASLGSGAFGRSLLGRHEDGLLFWALLVLGVGLVALPLMLGEAALGQSRRRNVADAFGPGPWAVAGWLQAIACVPLAAFLAVLAADAARLAYDSFQGGFYDDPDRHMRLITQGWDVMLVALGVFLVAAAAAKAGSRGGLRGPMTAIATVALVAVALLLGYALLETGSAGRGAAFAFDLDGLAAASVVQALQQALVPAFLGFGVVATMSGHVHDRTLPREATMLALLWLLVPFGLGAFLAAFANQQGVGLGDGFPLEGAVRLFAAIGGTKGGVLAGTFFGLLLAGCFAALVAVLEVPATLLGERVPGLGEARANFGVALLAYLVAVPLCFAVDGLADLGLVLTAVVGPLGGLLVALHVGWVRPDVLDGFVVGDAHHRLDRFLRPVLRYVLPLPLLALLAVGVLQVCIAFGDLDAGSGGLWRLVP